MRGKCSFPDLATKGTRIMAPLLPNFIPVPRVHPAPHLSRRALQGVAVQQNDLQVPEAAEGDRDVGDTVTGEIQADQRKVPQLWGWVREESGAGLSLGSCAPFLTLCSGGLVTPDSITASALVGSGLSPEAIFLFLFLFTSAPYKAYFNLSSCPALTYLSILQLIPPSSSSDQHKT